MQRRPEPESDNLHISMVELVGPRAAQPTSDHAPTLPFLRGEDVTDKVVRIAPIDDDTVPFSYEPSEPYELLEVREVAPVTRRALRASRNLVAGDPVQPTAPVPSRRAAPIIAVTLLAGALAVGVGLSFLVAAIAR